LLEIVISFFTKILFFLIYKNVAIALNILSMS